MAWWPGKRNTNYLRPGELEGGPAAAATALRGVLRRLLAGEEGGGASSEVGGTAEEAPLLGVERVERPGDDILHTEKFD